MGSSQNLGGQGNKIEVTWDLEKQTAKPGGNTVWVLKIKVCNKTNRQLKGAVAENPWRAPKDIEKIQYDKDASGKQIPDSDKKHAKASAQSFDLAPGECTTLVFTYDIEPGQAYTDIYERKPDGTLRDDWTWGTVEKLQPVQVSLAPPQQEQVFAVSMPMPYPMALDASDGEPAWLAISSIDLPEGFELAHSFPTIGAPIRLAAADRGSQAVIVLRQIEGLPEGGRSSLTIWERVVRPPEMTYLPERPVRVELVNDRTPPAIEVVGLHLDARALTVEAQFVDQCSGVAEIEAIVFDADDGVLRVSGQITSDVGDSPVCATFQIPADAVRASRSIALRAADAVGNEAVVRLPRVSAGRPELPTEPAYEWRPAGSGQKVRVCSPERLAVPTERSRRRGQAQLP